MKLRNPSATKNTLCEKEYKKFTMSGKENILYKFGKLSLKLLKLFTGLFLLQFAVAMFLRLNIGADPFSVLIQGLAGVLSVSAGTSNFILLMILLVFVFFLDKSQFQVGMALVVLAAGSFLDATTALVGLFLPEKLPLPAALCIFMAACVLIAIAFPLLKSAGLGVAPNDAFYLGIIKRTKLPYGIVRSVVDGCYLLLGYVCGGVVGIGTIICVVVLGPMIQFVMKNVIRCE